MVEEEEEKEGRSERRVYEMRLRWAMSLGYFIFMGTNGTNNKAFLEWEMTSII